MKRYDFSVFCINQLTMWVKTLLQIYFRIRLVWILQKCLNSYSSKLSMIQNCICTRNKALCIVLTSIFKGKFNQSKIPIQLNAKKRFHNPQYLIKVSKNTDQKIDFLSSTIYNYHKMFKNSKKARNSLCNTIYLGFKNWYVHTTNK